MSDQDSRLARTLAAIHYAASHSDVENLLDQLSSPEHDVTRWGGPSADRTFRGILADALSENGREPEAELLRNPTQHVVVHEGQVRPGRWTLRHLREHARLFGRRLDPMWNADPGYDFMFARPPDHDWVFLHNGQGDLIPDEDSPPRHLMYADVRGVPHAFFAAEGDLAHEHPLPLDQIRDRLHRHMLTYVSDVSGPPVSSVARDTPLVPIEEPARR
jgi:hypothetical protein